MKMVIFFLCFVFSLSLQAQEKKRSVLLFGHALFAKNAETGIGLGIKYLAGSNGKEFLSISGSFNLFPLRSEIDNDASHKKTMPLLAGYHRRFGNFYIEPQAGVGFYSGRIITPEFALPSRAAFFWGAESGYMFNKFSIQVKYYTAHSKKSEYLSNPFSYLAAGISYDIKPARSLKRK